MTRSTSPTVSTKRNVAVVEDALETSTTIVCAAAIDSTGDAAEAAPWKATLVKIENKTSQRFMRKKWSGWRDLNPRPLVPQTSALTKLRHSPYAREAT
ncbi:MAG: hypothetical protein RIQ64_47 [Actinomycetota bacterium]